MALKDHQDPRAFTRMAQGHSSPAEARGIVRHLLAGCAECGQIAEQLRQEASSPASWSYDDVFARVEQLIDRVAEERPARMAAAGG